MKHLTLFRHAKSSWRYPQDDIFRPLNERGRRQGQMMAHECALPAPDIIYCSAACRAYCTALFYLHAYQLPVSSLQLAADLYQSSWIRQMTWLKTLSDEFNRVWLFGHNPEMSDLAANLNASSSSQEGKIKLVTSAYVSLCLPINHWALLQSNTGEVSDFIRPNKKPD